MKELHGSEQAAYYASNMQEQELLPELSIKCFGHFEVRQAGHPLMLCSNRNAQMIFRYLTVQDRFCASVEKLLAVAWPEDAPHVARNKLHIAISALRRMLHARLTYKPDVGYLVCRNHMYMLNDATTIHTDVNEFLYHYHMGQQQQCEEARIGFYEQACQQYKGPFLPEDIYADWSFLHRERFSNMHLAMCRTLASYYFQHNCYEEAASWAMIILMDDHCDETAHQQLMQIYAAQGYRSKAIQQYYTCERALRQELGIEPLSSTTQLFRSLYDVG
ncbi:MAG: hypothetical protein HC828_00990 [Blastochloris sp.]|nr:hypothetical protein [Blastochloris sp.]